MRAGKVLWAVQECISQVRTIEAGDDPNVA